MRRSGDIDHTFHWCTRKLRSVARSNSTAELLAASDAASSLLYLQCLLYELTYHHEAYMLIYYRALLNLETAVKAPTKPAKKIDLQFLLEYFVPSTVAINWWVPVYYNVADCMTKYNRT